MPLNLRNIVQYGGDLITFPLILIIALSLLNCYLFIIFHVVMILHAGLYCFVSDRRLRFLVIKYYLTL